MNETVEWDLKEVSRETFNDMIESEDAIASLGEPIDEDTDIIVTHYYEQYTQAYLGTIRVTEDGTLYLVPDLIVEPITMEEAHRLLNGGN